MPIRLLKNRMRDERVEPNQAKMLIESSECDLEEFMSLNRLDTTGIRVVQNNKIRVKDYFGRPAT